MRTALVSVAIPLAMLAGNALGDVINAGKGGFSLVHETTVAASRATVWQAAVGDVGRWWSDDHTISGDAAAMHIDATPLGCFCEVVGDGGTVVHLTVTFVNPNVMLRLTGGLGPLGLMGIAGNMTWEFFDAQEGTRVRFAYAVGGYDPNGLDNIAGAVDAVIGEQLQRLKAFVETGSADVASGDAD